MKKSEINQKFREHARTLSPKPEEQKLVKEIYESFNNLFGDQNCLPIGSFPRFTSITPIHDFDLLYILGSWNESEHTPTSALQALYDKINTEYENPTDYDLETSFQTHSITISYLAGKKVKLSVDIVPAYICFKNEFKLDTYMVPEVVKRKGIEQRQKYYEELRQENREMDWINSDPRGYIKIASDTDSATNGEFRKSVKLVKRWKHNLKEKMPDLKLKSFHLEQVVTEYFKNDPSFTIFDAFFKFFNELPGVIEKPNQIPDRARNDKFIDDYLEKLTRWQKEKITIASHRVLIALEQIEPSTDIETIIEANFAERNPDEEYLFDYKIPVHTDVSAELEIDFDEVSPNRKERRRAEKRRQSIGNKLYFKIVNGYKSGANYWWKVKNSELLESNKRRGEITKGSTRHNPESTLYPGSHYVECYEIDSSGICISRARVNVVIEGGATV